jgi:hypothetical protein
MKLVIKNKNKNKTQRVKNIIKPTSGGKVLTSGGFGCLFKPALKCKNQSKMYHSKQKMVTKLMTTSHAKDEYSQITEFKSILDHIPNYQNYFLVDGFSICEPAELTNNDLKDFDDNCTALKKKDITANNINQNLNKILALNMPDGGIDVDDYIFKVTNKSNLVEVYTELNISLINLLVNGIDPMNKAQLYHCDVKGSNILVSETQDEGMKTRLIDWGLSVYRKNESNTSISDNLDRRPFQFNVPFSVILFNKKFIEKYKLFLKRHETVDFYAIREFVINYIFYWNKIRGTGHLKTINSIFKRLTHNGLPAIENDKIKNHIVEYDFTYYYIIEYISKILLKYTVGGKLNLFDYFNNIFLKNIDIWGLTIIYVTFLNNLYEIYKDTDKMNTYHILYIEKIKYIIIRYLFETPTQVIDINELSIDLKSLNNIVANFNTVEKNRIHLNTKNYFLSLTKISNEDIKGIGGQLNKTKRIVTNKNTKTKKTRK